MMTLKALYDGQVFVPDEPVALSPGTPVTIQYEPPAAADACKFAELLSIGQDLADAPHDLAEQHDHYLYGTPRR